MISLLKQKFANSSSQGKQTKNRLIQALMSPILVLLILGLFGQSQALDTTNPLLSSTAQFYTTNDGVSFDQHVTSIDMNGQGGIQIPLDNQRLNQKLEYTVMMWFKPKSPMWNMEYSYAFSFPESLECYFTPQQTLTCENNSLTSSLKANVAQVYRNQWTHLAVGGSPSTESYAQITQNLGRNIDFQYQDYIELVQKNSDWRLCVGGCGSAYAFIGSFREVVYYSKQLPLSTAYKLKNEYISWRSDLQAYYRFASPVNIRKAEYRNQFALLQNDTYTVQVENIPNDICYPIYETDSFIQFTNSKDIQPLTVDARWSPKSSNWGYSASIWVKIDDTTCIASSGSIGSESCHLVKLNDAFMIYSPAPNQIAGYIFSERKFTEFQTRSVLVPSGIWVNLQFAASHYGGYELRVYDLFGREYSAVSESKTMTQQSIRSREISMLRGFTGQVRNLIVYASRKTLPLTNANLQIEPNTYYINDTDCLGFFQFQSQHSSVNQTDFSPIAENLFDGITCKDGSYSVKLQSSNSFIQAETGLTNQTLPNVTIEFWFKLERPMNETGHLFQLWSQEKQAGFFSIFYDYATNSLLCAPFGLNSVRSPYVNYTDFNQTTVNQTGWFHIVCGYEFQKDVFGSLHKGSSSWNYRKSIAESLLDFPNDTYHIIIGNNFTKNNGSAQMMIKELRLWGSKRTQSQIDKWRHRQLDLRGLSYPEIISYMRFNQGSMKDSNLVSLVNSTVNSQVVFNGTTVQSDTQLTICPPLTYISADKKCYQNPVQYLLPTVYPEVTNGTLNWTFTSIDSHFIDPSYAMDTLVHWHFEDPIIRRIAQSQTDKHVVTLSASTFRDSAYYRVRLNFTNSDSTFLEFKDFTFAAQSCQYYIVSGSDARNGFFNSSKPQSTEDVTFTLQLVSRRADCATTTFFNTLVQSVSYDISPPLSVKPEVQYTFNSNGNIVVTIPKSQQGTLPVMTDLKFIFKIQWTNSVLQNEVNEALPQDTIFQNVKYTIRFNELGQQIVPQLTKNSTAVLLGEGIILSAAGTTITNSVQADYERLSYRWQCPDFLQSFCDISPNSITIPHLVFKTNNGTYGQNYQFTVHVTYQQSNGQQSNASTSITVVWLNQTSPIFNIVAPSTILSTAASQQLEVQFLELSNSQLPSNLQIQWSIVPNLTASTGTFSTDNKVHTVSRGGFKTSTQYQITVIAFYQGFQTETTRTKTMSFRTQQPPSGGSISVNPMVGVVNETDFTVQLSNWQSSNRPIRFRVWYTTNVGGQTPRAPISQEYTQDTQTFTFKAVDTFPYIVEVTDQSGEVVFVNLAPAVTNGNNGTQLNRLTLKLALNSDQASTRYAMMAQYLNDDLKQDTGIDKSESIYQRQQILNSMKQDIDNLQNRSTSQDSKTIVKGTVEVVSLMMKNQEKLNTQLISESVTAISKIREVDASTYKALRKDQSFKESLASVASSAFLFVRKIMGNGRLLLQEDIATIDEKARILRQDLLEQLCQDSVINSQQSMIDAPAFTLNTQKFSLDTQSNSTLFSNQLKSLSSVLFNVNSLMTQLKQTVPQTESVCIQTTFYKVQPEYSPKKFKRYSSSVVEFEIIDDANNYRYTSAHYNPSEATQLQFQISDPAQFQTNQSVCMQYQATTQVWDDEVCITNIDEDNLLINCKCNMMNSQYYGVFTDESRVRGEALKVKPSNHNVTDPHPDYDYNYEEWRHVEELSFSFISVVFVILFFVTVIPTASIILDKKDLRCINERKLQTEDKSLIKSLAVLSNQSEFYWFYKFSEVQNFSNMPTSIIFQKTHLLANLFTTFDIQFQRIWRFTSILLSFSLFSLICVLIYGPNYRKGDRMRIENGLDSQDINTSILVGVLGMILMLPLPLKASIFKDQIVKSQDKSEERNSALNYLPDVNHDQQVKVSPTKPLGTHHRVNSTNNIYGPNNHSRVELSNREITAIQQSQTKIVRRCYFLRCFLLFASYVMCLVSVVLCIVYSAQMPVSNQYCMVASFFNGVFGSILITNMIRSLVNIFLSQKLMRSQKCMTKLLISEEAQELLRNYETLLQARNEVINDGTQQINHERLPQTFNSSKKELNFVNYSRSQTQSIDVTGEVSIMKRIDTEDQDSQNRNINERHSLVKSVHKQESFSMKLSPKSATQYDLRNDHMEDLGQQNSDSPHMNTHTF